MANLQSYGISGNPSLQLSADCAAKLEGLINPVDRRVVIATHTTLTKAAHQGMILVCTTGALNLTVNNSTEFDDCESALIINETGAAVTVVNTATVNIVTGKTRVIQANGVALLIKNTADDTYTLSGDLTAA